jgi:alginate O-acetyltransferase complex protein AlgI
VSFVSFTFAGFFLIVLALRIVLDRLPQRGPRLAMLLVASLVFYAWSQPRHLLLLLGVATVGYLAGGVLGALPPRGRRARAVVGVAVSAGLGLLGFFKYFDYLVAGLGSLEATLGFGAIPVAPLDLVLPLGISFYTFEMISYAVDVYRGRIAPVRRFSHVLLFIAFFPHLVAGPIVRAGEFVYQIDRRRRPRLRVMSEGLYLVIRGFFLKVVVADNLALVVDGYWAAAAEPGANASLGALVAVLFAFQILCDFDGYTTIARGTAYLLGFRLPINFDAPYIAATFREFWQRWHITLSRWLRDYLYLPLGGNRVGRVRLLLNLLVVMTLGGLWHGAANTFVVWGALHGTALAVERALGLERLSEDANVLARVLWWGVVQVTVVAGWVVFRSQTLDVAGALLGNIAGCSFRAFEPSIPLARLALLLAVPIGGHLRTLVHDRFGVRDLSPMEKGIWGPVMLYAICTAYGLPRSFIYFQF